MKRVTMALAVVVLACASAWALEDDKAAREKEADRYMAAMPVKEMFSDMADMMAKNMPAEKRQTFKDTFLKNTDMSAMEKEVKAALIKHFTTEELKALADFYGSPVGKSAMKKLPGYMMELMPKIQPQIMKAIQKANEKPEGEEKPAE